MVGRGYPLTIARPRSSSPDCCLSTDTRGMRAVNRCFQHTVTLSGLERTLHLILTPGPKGIIVGLIRCPCFGILLFIESMRNYSLPAHRLNIAPVSILGLGALQSWVMNLNCTVHNRTTPATPCGPQRNANILVGPHSPERPGPGSGSSDVLLCCWRFGVDEFVSRNSCSGRSRRTNDGCSQ